MSMQATVEKYKYKSFSRSRLHYHLINKILKSCMLVGGHLLGFVQVPANAIAHDSFCTDLSNYRPGNNFTPERLGNLCYPVWWAVAFRKHHPPKFKIIRASF
jgi:hypothetical protein